MGNEMPGVVASLQRERRRLHLNTRGLSLSLLDGLLIAAFSSLNKERIYLKRVLRRREE